MNEGHVDSITLATQLGRLDLVSLLLTAIGLILVVGGVFAFLNLRAVARKQATEEATKIAEKTAERKANEYLQDNLHVIAAAYTEIMVSLVKEGDDDEIASSQDNPEEES